MVMGAPKSPNNVTSTFFNAVHLLLKELSFQPGSAKLVSCPGRHVTLLRPWARVGILERLLLLSTSLDLV